jgi:hypothetical protein
MAVGGFAVPEGGLGLLVGFGGVLLLDRSSSEEVVRVEVIGVGMVAGGFVVSGEDLELLVGLRVLEEVCGGITYELGSWLLKRT